MTVLKIQSSNLSPKKLSSLLDTTTVTEVDQYAATEWPTMPSMVQGDNKICIIVGVSSIIGIGSTAYGDAVLAFDAKTNAPPGSLSTVDWGDGNTETVSTASSVQHKYLYDNVNLTPVYNDPLSSVPYKAALVTITPPVGYAFTSFSINHYGSNFSRPAGRNQSNPCLSIKMAGSSVVDLDMGNRLINNVNLREFEYVGIHSITDMITYFSGCTNLRTIKFDLTGVTRLGNTATTLDGAFNSAYSLRNITFTGITTSITQATGAFISAVALKEAPNLDLSRCTNTSFMFSDCRSLRKVPRYDLRNCINSISMFNANRSIREFDGFDTFNSAVGISSLTTAESMFSGCFSLVKAPYFNTSRVTTFASMFRDCYSLKYIPAYPVNRVTSLNSFAFDALTLERFPSFTPKLSPINDLRNAMTNCDFLTIIGYNNFITATSGTSNFAASFRLKRSLLKGPRGSHSYLNCFLGPNALNEIYSNLPQAAFGQIITVTGNYGASQDDPTIATNKGWTVTD